MMRYFAQRRHRRLLCPFFVVFGLSAAALSFDSQILEIGNQGLFLPVANGDVVSHEFTHSMYDVRVVERFRIENGWLHLFHVHSESSAALEYYGIDNKHENNVHRQIRQFNVPVESIGSHVLNIRNHSVSLEASQTSEHGIHIRLSSRPAIVNWACSLWR